MRTGEIHRVTNETDIKIWLSPDGGERKIYTGIGFFDHMLTALAVHGGLGLLVEAKGDLAVDCHHTVEDVGIALGQALAAALGDKRGIVRFADVHVPMDEALAFCALDISGRAYLAFDAAFQNPAVGAYDTCMTKEFMRAFSANAGLTLHLSCRGENDHHVTEALFKALARALRAAVRVEGGGIPSSKGVL